MRKHLCVIIIALAATVAPALAASKPVAVVPLPDARQIWIPAPASRSDVEAARREYEQYVKTWRRFFGAPPALPAILKAAPKTSRGRDVSPLFDVLWTASSTALPAGDREAARQALRAMVLGETRPTLDALRKTLAEKRLLPAQGAEMLWYLFLNEEAADPSILPHLFPPGRRGGKLMDAVDSPGGRRLLQNRMAVWVLQHAAADHLLPQAAPAEAPAVWIVGRDLAPGSFTLWKIRIPDWAGSLHGEAAGDLKSGGLRLLSLFSDPGGNVVLSGAGTLAHSDLLFPAASSTLWLVLWNPPGGKEAGYGLSLTFWGEAAPPFTVLKTTGGPGHRSVLIRESPGMAGFDLWGRASAETSFRRLPLPSIPDRGQGTHLYHFIFPTKGAPLQLKLRGMTWSGGTYWVPLGGGDTGDTP